MAPAVFFLGFDAWLDNCRVIARVVLPRCDPPNEIQGTVVAAPTERDAFDLEHLSTGAVAFDHGVLLGSVAARGIVEEQIAVKLEAVAAAPGHSRQVVGKLLRRRRWVDNPRALAMEHDSPPFLPAYERNWRMRERSLSPLRRLRQTIA
mgnify:CR=1 FL=1